MKIKLVENWRNSWKWFSMQCMAASGALQGAWLAIPESMKSTIPPEWVSYATVFMLLLGVLGRLVSQSQKQ